VDSVSLRPGISRGFYPQQAETERTGLEKAIVTLGSAARQRLSRAFQRRGVPLERIHEWGETYAACSEDALRDAVRDAGRRLYADGFLPELVAQSFALIREVAGRVLGMSHYDVQLRGGWALLYGNVVEMQTGEGKTLTALLAAATAALARVPVHVITVNDYLVERDASELEPVYAFLGLEVGAIVDGMDHAARQQAYGRDVVYCTNKQIAFDYLRDRLLMSRKPGRLRFALDGLSSADPLASRLLLRGLCYAIVDEADSVFIDEARTPLILSRARDGAKEAAIYGRALSFAQSLEDGVHFIADYERREIELSEAGQAWVAEKTEGLGGLWSSRRRAEELVAQALRALYLFIRDVQYLVRDGKVIIVDEYTGRTMPDRSWEQGLHQLIELKEGCEVTAPPETLARISYQRFFKRYLHLAGLTGTAAEVRGELWSAYGLPVMEIPTHLPSRRSSHPSRLYATAERKWRAVAEATRVKVAEGRAVLIGTRSVEASAALSAQLTREGIPHRVLSAAQDGEEASIVAAAGQPGAVTVATNMAGRGTDIKLHPAVRDNGGLHVIATERHSAGRIDRQLFGRCARQGDPGSIECIASLDDELTSGFYSRSKLGGIERSMGPSEHIAGRRADRIMLRPQRRAEKEHAGARRKLLEMDEHLSKMLALGGGGE